MAINEEALSVNEEYQSTNEELMSSKEELQSLNEELNALNSQLQETLERQRTTADDLQNVLYSTDVATIFLDTSFNIRFFTPATKALFNVIPGDVGRPLTDLKSLALDERSAARRSAGSGNPGADRARNRGSGRRVVHAANIAVSDARQEDRGRRHYFCRRHGEKEHGGGAIRRKAAGGVGEHRQVALSRRGEP